MIAAHGLLQNLVVRVELKLKKDTGRRGVVAGGRRLRALELLCSRGQLPADHPVRCRLVSQERALAVSLAQNSGREALHGADRLDAIMAMEEQGRTAQQIADARGVSVLTVERRLKLGALAPALLDLYREDGIDLDQLEALALLDDQAQQHAVWKGLPQHYRSAAVLAVGLPPRMEPGIKTPPDMQPIRQVFDKITDPAREQDRAQDRGPER